MPDSSPSCILDHQQVSDRIERIAWQIYESSNETHTVILAGIADRGYLLAEKLFHKLQNISSLELSLHRLTLDKDRLREVPALLSPECSNYENCTVIVIDDVLNSGSTLIYGVEYFLKFPLKELKTAVLVDRNHKRYPVKADFKGLSLSTSMKEHVSVNIEEEPYSVLLS